MKKTVACLPSVATRSIPIPVLTTARLLFREMPPSNEVLVISNTCVVYLSSDSILMYLGMSPYQAHLVSDIWHAEVPTHQSDSKNTAVHWLCINNVSRLSLACSRLVDSGSVNYHVTNMS